ncbi:hypothetical protein BD626DRAFT_513622 [Schizophyllum amplum]|uniref:Uncharacterized protein n=1 Tax=Schizophyllum amplum TaxID=97359 RepID=A0A550BZ44_9AGAR|nr:hypothetical protein BD626DRAFT_513622 [Auriculariopsis ampla]
MEIGFSYSRYDTHAVGLFLASVFPWPTLVIEDVHGDARVEAINLAIESTKPAPTKSLTTKQAHRRAKRVPVSPEVRDKLTARHQLLPRNSTAVEPVVAAEPPKTRASKRKRGADSLVVQEDARPAKTRKIPTKTQVKRTTEPTRRSERLRAKASKAQNGQGDRD